MCDQESAEKPQDHGTQYILPSKTEPPDVTLKMEVTEDSKVETSKEFIENNTTANIAAKPTPEEVDLCDIFIDNTKLDTDKKQSIRRDNENIEKCLQNSNFITLQVFDTYYGQPQKSQIPHRHLLPSRTGGDDYAGPVFAYDPAARRRFIKLTFTIVLFMIIVTSVVLVLIMNTDSIRLMFRRHHKLFYVIGVVLLLISHYAMYFSSCARVMPCNIIFLTLAITAYCAMAGNLTVRYKTHIILYGVMATAACVFICLLLACSRFDFTGCLIYVIIVGVVFSVVTAIVFVQYLITHHIPKPLHIAILIGGTLLQVVTLIIELQMILGGKSVELNEEDYSLGAFMLYTSIMTIFMNMTQLIDLPRWITYTEDRDRWKLLKKISSIYIHKPSGYERFLN